MFRLEQSQGPEDMFRVTDALAQWLRERDDLLRGFLAWIHRVLLPQYALGVEPTENHIPTVEELKLMLQESTPRTWAQIAKEQGEEEGLRRGLQEGLREGLQQGIQEGRRKGRLQGRIELLEEMLETKFGALEDSIRSRLYEASSEDLLRWGTRFVSAETLGDVFG